MPLAPWRNTGPGKRAARPQAESKSFASSRMLGPGHSRRPPRARAPGRRPRRARKKFIPLENEKGSKNHPRPRGGPKKFIPSENATVTHNLDINFSGGRSTQSALPDRALASRQQGRAGALAPVSSPTSGQVKPRAGAAWRRSRSTRFEGEFGRHCDGWHAPQKFSRPIF